MVTAVALLTGVVVTVKLAVVVPAATVTLAGVVAAALLPDSETMDPPEGAGPFSVTVPVEETPPVTAAGFIVTLVSEGGLIRKVVVFVTPL